MKDLNKALQDYRQFYKLYSLSDLKPVEEIKFRLFCIKGEYDAAGYSDISSLENVLYEQIKNRPSIDTLAAMFHIGIIPSEILIEEAEINRLISESYYVLLKLKDKNKDKNLCAGEIYRRIDAEKELNKIAQEAIDNYPETFKQLEDGK